MNTHKPIRLLLVFVLSTFFIVIIITALATGNHVLAQGTGPDGPVNNSPSGSTTTASQGDGLTVVDVPITPLNDSGDGLPEGMKNTGVQAEDPLALDNILATFSYYRLVGTAFNVRTSSTTFAYNFNGCVYETGGTDNRFMAPVLIPDNSVIKFLRLYYNDTNPSSNITAWLTRYQPGVTSEDLTSVISAGESGYGTTLSSEITHTVDLTNWAYTIIIAPNANAASNSFCGIRVAYYAPTFGAVALPLVRRGIP
jgi:hypothetical protein